MKQRESRLLDEAVTASLEMESYSRTGPGRVAHVRSEGASVVATMRDVSGSNALMDKLSDEARQHPTGTEFGSGHQGSDRRSADMDSGAVTGDCNQIS